MILTFILLTFLCRQFRPQVPSHLKSVQRKPPPSASDRSSGESTPTPTASSVAAERSQAQTYHESIQSVNLTPVTLVSPAPTPEPGQQRQSSDSARVSSTRTSSADTFSSPAPIRISLAQSSSQDPPPNESARPASVKSSPSSIFLPDGTEIPLVRTDLSKLIKVTRSSRSGTLSSSTNSEGRNAGSSALNQPEKMSSGGGSGTKHTREEKGKGRGSQDFKATPSGLDSAEMERSIQVSAAPNVAGHLLAASPEVIQRRDGSTRAIYSPTPEKLAEARGQVPSSSNHPRTPVDERAEAPPTPHLSTLRRFSKSDPSLATPNSSRPGTGAGGPEPTTQGRAADDLMLTASRRTFGPQATLFTEASRLLEMEQRRQSKFSSDSEDAPLRRRSRSDSLQKSLHRDSFSSDTTAFESPALGSSSMMLDRSNSGKRRSFSLDGDRISFGDGRERLVSGMVAPPSDVVEAKEPPSDGEGSVTSEDTQFDPEEKDQFTLNSKPKRKDLYDEDDEESESRIIPITNTRNQPRPGTAQTRFSTKSAESQLRHGRRAFSGPTHAKNVACRQCFRAGFDCAMNLQLGEGTAGRKAFQEFVTSGGLEALSIENSPTSGGRKGARPTSANLSISEALGNNYVDKLGEVKFGESALSRPVTRGVVDQMLEDRGKELAEKLNRITVDDFREQLHRGAARSYGGEEDYDDLEEDLDLDLEFDEIFPTSQSQQRKRRTSSLRTPPRGITPSLQLEEGEIVQLSHLKQRYQPSETEGATMTFEDDDDLEILADRWSTTRKVIQVGVCLLFIFSVEVVDAGYVSEHRSQVLISFFPRN